MPIKQFYDTHTYIHKHTRTLTRTHTHTLTHTHLHTHTLHSFHCITLCTKSKTWVHRTTQIHSNHILYSSVFVNINPCQNCLQKLDHANENVSRILSFEQTVCPTSTAGLHFNGNVLYREAAQHSRSPSSAFMCTD